MLSKTCARCRATKPIAAFNKKGKKKDGSIRYQPYCKTCNSEKCKAYYAENKSYHLSQITERKQKYIERNRSYVFQYLLSNPCKGCGEASPVKLDFDHRKSAEKEDIVSSLIWRPVSLTRLKTEISKCDVLCANCHREKTAIDHQWWIHTEYQKHLNKQRAGVTQHPRSETKQDDAGSCSKQR